MLFSGDLNLNGQLIIAAVDVVVVIVIVIFFISLLAATSASSALNNSTNKCSTDTMICWIESYESHNSILR